MVGYIINTLLECLLLTIIIETSFSIILGVRDKLDILDVVLVQVVTNPVVVSVSLYLGMFYPGIRNITVYILEILVVLSEGLMYKKFLSFKKINPFLLSLLLNVISYVLGLFIY